MSLIVSLLAGIIVMILLIYFYQQRDEPEAYLGFKLVGYYLLCAFTLRLNGFPLPAGFLLFLLFCRPTRNVTSKHRAAILGLAVFFVQLIVPAVEEYVYERQHELPVSNDNVYQLRFTEDWSRIREEMQIEPDAHLEDFRAEYEKNGQLLRLSYELVARTEEGFIHYDIEFSPEAKEYRIRRHKVGQQWAQYERTVRAARFFEVLDHVQVRNLRPEQPSGRIVLNSDGEFTSYAIKNNKKVLIQGHDMKELTNEELPIKGFFIDACSIVTSVQSDGSGTTVSHSCQGEVDYLFDTAKRE